MANPVPLLLVAAAFLLLRKKGDSSSSTGSTGSTGSDGQTGSKAADDAEEYVPGSEAEGEGEAPQLTASLVIQPTYQTRFIPNAPPPEPPESEVEVPAGTHCSPVDDWDPSWVAIEEAMLAAVNELRATGYACVEGAQSPAPPLTMNPHLRCSARLHSRDMALKGYFSHTNQEGEESWDRMWAAGYQSNKLSENITAGPSSVQAALQNFLTSNQGHCSAMFDPTMTEAGIGYFPHSGGYQFYWTQNFGGA